VKRTTCQNHRYKRLLLNDKFQFLRNLIWHLVFCEATNGMRYLRWGGDGEAVQPEKG
jgi:hypothetical protein